MLEKRVVNYLVVFLLFVIISVGFIVRVYRLSEVPAGFFCDEAAIGYNAYTLLTTGKDEYEIPFPFFFRSFGDYRLPVPIYSNIPFIAVFGLNEFSIRFTAAFFGTLTIFILYLLMMRLFKNKYIALFSSLFLAISPWHIHFSRFGSEYIYFPFWFSLALYIFLLGLENRYLLYLSSFIFGISLYTYYPSLFTVPLFFIFLILIFFKRLKTAYKSLLISVFIFIVTLIPFSMGVFQGTVMTRWQQVSVFKSNFQPDTKSKMIRAYFAHFSFDFLFTKGDVDYPGHFIRRFSVRGVGELYPFQLPLLILGVIPLIKNKNFRSGFFILFFWFILYPLGSSLTSTDGGAPFAFRSIFGVIPFQILSAIGIFWIIKQLGRFRHNINLILTGLLIIIFLSVAFFSFGSYMYKYFVEYPIYSSDFWGWQYGPKEVMRYFLTEYRNYDELYIMGNFNAPEIFPKFYDPKNICQGRCKIGGLGQFDQNKKQLYAIGVDRINEVGSYEFTVKKIINYQNGNSAFLIGSLMKKN